MSINNLNASKWAINTEPRTPITPMKTPVHAESTSHNITSIIELRPCTLEDGTILDSINTQIILRIDSEGLLETIGLNIPARACDPLDKELAAWYKELCDALAQEYTFYRRFFGVWSDGYDTGTLNYFPGDSYYSPRVKSTRFTHPDDSIYLNPRVKAIIPGINGGAPVNVLLDTGATTTVIDASLIPADMDDFAEVELGTMAGVTGRLVEMELGAKLHEFTLLARAPEVDFDDRARADHEYALGKVNGKTFSNIKGSVTAYIANLGDTDIILGMDALEPMGADILVSKRVLCAGDTMVPIYMTSLSGAAF